MSKKEPTHSTVSQLVDLLKTLPQNLPVLTDGYENGFENENPRTAPKNKTLLSDNPDFNELWDENYGEFAMSDYSYPASKVLFYTDNKAYLTELRTFKEVKD